MLTRFRQLHGYWDSPEISSDSYDGCIRRLQGTDGISHRASLRRYTGYSFVSEYYTACRCLRQLFFRKEAKTVFLQNYNETEIFCFRNELLIGRSGILRVI